MVQISTKKLFLERVPYLQSSSITTQFSIKRPFFCTHLRIPFLAYFDPKKYNNVKAIFLNFMLTNFLVDF